MVWLCRIEKMPTILKLPPKKEQEEWSGYIHRKGLRDPPECLARLTGKGISLSEPISKDQKR